METVTSTIAIYYLLNAAGRREALSQGLPAHERQMLVLTPESPEWSRAVSLVTVGSDGSAVLEIGHEYHVATANRDAYYTPTDIVRDSQGYEAHGGPLAVGRNKKSWAELQTPDDLLQWELQRRLDVDRVTADREVTQEDRLAAKKIMDAQKLKQRRAEAREWLDAHYMHCDLPAVVALSAIIEDPEGDPDRAVVGWFSALSRAAAAVEVAEYLDAQHATPEERKAVAEAFGHHVPHAVTAIKRSRAQQAQLAWIKEHGSARLQLCAAEEIEHDAIYRDERLALERPGWRWERDVAGEEHEPRNPPLEALELLTEARETDPDCCLMWWTVERDDGFEDCDGEDDNELYSWTGYVVRGELLDRDIILGGPES